MSDLTLIKSNGQLLVDSREVAAMVDKNHADLLRDIKKYVDTLGKSNFALADFFIESTYEDAQGKPRPHFLLTRKGCDMVANKMTGEKGVLFTAAYVTKFEEMERTIKSQQLPQTFAQALRLAAELEEQKERLQLENKQKEQIINELQPKATYYDLVLQTKSVVAITKIAKDYGLSGQALNAMLHELGVQYKQGDCWLLYQRYADKGYTQSKTHVIDSEKSKMNTYWTQKGRLFIYDLLKNSKCLLPLIEREKEPVSC